MRLSDLTAAPHTVAMRAAPHQADGEAVIAVRAGKHGAFRVLFDRYQRPLLGLLVRMTGRPADAEDLAQQTFVDAYAALGRFDTSRQFSAWLFHIAMNKGKDWLKSRKRG